MPTVGQNVIQIRGKSPHVSFSHAWFLLPGGNKCKG